jgi:hypothetical protein
MDQTRLRDRIADRQDHRVGQPCDERHVHAHPLLLRPAGQAELHADEDLPSRHPRLEVSVLDLVTDVEVQLGPLLGEGGPLDALVLSSAAARLRPTRRPRSSAHPRRHQAAERLFLGEPQGDVDDHVLLATDVAVLPDLRQIACAGTPYRSAARSACRRNEE